MRTERPFSLEDIDHVVLRVRDLEVMMNFYIDVLGCRLEKVQEELGLYQLRAGKALIDMVPVDGPLGRQGGAPPGADGLNMDHLCLGVTPFDGAEIIAFLQRQGADPGPVKSRYGAQGQGPSIYVTDPEGNVVELKGPPSAQQEPAR